ncbi:MAG: glycosyltransferase [Thermoguttaceae bacterium]|nr:glycosyltransferase [Thermoguttaceae bacterium]
MSIKLSINCITYNHAKFIRQALDGFVMQKTNFPFEVLIHDDASTDGTADIIREYEAKYPEIIKPIYQTENQYSKGVSISRTFNWPRIQGEYVAMCEGDDNWTDPNKLQKQVDFLDSHPDYMGCFHPAKMVWEDMPGKSVITPTPYQRFYRKEFTAKDILYRNFIPTASVVYRWDQDIKQTLINDFPSGIISGDTFFHLVMTKRGKIYMLDEVMSIYRIHQGGITTAGDTQSVYLRHGRALLRQYCFFDKLLEYKFSKIAEKNKYYVLFAIYRDSIMRNNYELHNRLNIQMPWPFENKWFKSFLKLFFHKPEGFFELGFLRLCVISGLGKKIKWAKEEIGEI